MRVEEQKISWPQAVKGTPWEGRPEAMRHLAIRRGVYSTKMLRAKKAKDTKRIDDEAKRVNKLARINNLNLKDVMKDSTISLNQYYAAKGRLNLPHIKRRSK